MCKLQERDDIGRIELVQKLARENYQFLQTDKKEQEKSEHVSPFPLGDAGWKGKKMLLLGYMFERIFYFKFSVFFPPQSILLSKKTDAHSSKPVVNDTGFISELLSKVSHVEI